MNEQKCIFVNIVDNGYIVMGQAHGEQRGFYIAATKEQVLASVSSLLDVLDGEEAKRT